MSDKGNAIDALNVLNEFVHASDCGPIRKGEAFQSLALIRSQLVRSSSDIPDTGCSGCVHMTLETNGTVAHYNDECLECSRWYGDMYDNGEEEDA